MTVREITRGSAAQAGIALSILLYALRESLDVRSIENGEPYTAESVLRGRYGAPVRSRSLRRDATDPLRLPEQRSRNVGSEGLSQRLSPQEPDCFCPLSTLSVNAGIARQRGSFVHRPSARSGGVVQRVVNKYGHFPSEIALYRR